MRYNISVVKEVYMNTNKIPIAIVKKCGCGRQHSMIPVGARAQMVADTLVAYVWECECKSTMFYRLVSMAQYAELIDKEDAA
jgi:muramoyltetrapeptide carboxypeptidase LdcA involved in peptidoglycan recycling